MARAKPSAKSAAVAPARPPQGILRFFTPLGVSLSTSSGGHASLAASSRVEGEQRDGTETTTQVDMTAHSKTSEAASTTEDTRTYSEYERKRLARVAQNAQFLRELGMKTAQMDVYGALQKTHQAVVKKPKKHQKRLREVSNGDAGTRRSTRLRGIKWEEQEGTTTPRTTADDEEEEEKMSFDDSSVFKYTCTRGDTSVSTRTGQLERPQGTTLVGFRAANDTLADANLRKIYSISFSPFQSNTLIAAGGHQGQVSIFASPSIAKDDTGDATAPLMSFRAHRGWISSVSLAKSTVERNLLLTAANDGVVKLWDLNQSAGGKPKELVSVDDLHRNGIFGMDVAGDDVLTCSKDATIALSRFRADGSVLTITRRFEDHDGVVKCARFSQLNQNCVASGGNDKCIRIYDTRSDGSAASQVIVDAHARAINSVVWHPTQEHVILSASFDVEMHLYDLRKPASPLHVLLTSASQATGTSIFHPCFVANGEFVVSTGAGSQDQLSLHRTLDGSTISRGELPAKASYVICDPWSGRLLVAMGQQLQVFENEWRAV